MAIIERLCQAEDEWVREGKSTKDVLSPDQATFEFLHVGPHVASVEQMPNCRACLCCGRVIIRRNWLSSHVRGALAPGPNAIRIQGNRVASDQDLPGEEITSSARCFSVRYYQSWRLTGCRRMTRPKDGKRERESAAGRRPGRSLERSSVCWEYSIRNSRQTFMREQTSSFYSTWKMCRWTYHVPADA